MLRISYDQEMFFLPSLPWDEGVIAKSGKISNVYCRLSNTGWVLRPVGGKWSAKNELIGEGGDGAAGHNRIKLLVKFSKDVI